MLPLLRVSALAEVGRSESEDESELPGDRPLSLSTTPILMEPLLCVHAIKPLLRVRNYKRTGMSLSLSPAVMSYWMSNNWEGGEVHSN